MHRSTDALVAIPSSELARSVYPISPRMLGTARAVLRLVLGALDEHQQGIESMLQKLIGKPDAIFGAAADAIRLHIEVPQYKELPCGQIASLSDEKRMVCLPVEGGGLAHPSDYELEWKNGVVMVDTERGGWKIAMRREQEELFVIFQRKAGELVTHRVRVVPPVLIKQLFDRSRYGEGASIDNPWVNACLQNAGRADAPTALPSSIIGQLCDVLRQGLPMMPLFLMAAPAAEAETKQPLRPLLIERGVLFHKNTFAGSTAPAHRIRLWVHSSTARCVCCAVDPTSTESPSATAYVTIDLTFCGNMLSMGAEGTQGPYRCCAKHVDSKQHALDVGTFSMRCIDDLTVHLRCMHPVGSECKRYQCRTQRTLPFLPDSLWKRVCLGVLCSTVLDVHEHICRFRPSRNALEAMWERQRLDVADAFARIHSEENPVDEEEMSADNEDEANAEADAEANAEAEDEEAYHKWRASKRSFAPLGPAETLPAELVPKGVIPGDGSSTQVDAARFVVELLRERDIFASRGVWKRSKMCFSGVGSLQLRKFVLSNGGKVEWKRSKRLDWVEKNYAAAFPLVETLRTHRAKGGPPRMRYNPQRKQLAVFL
jgi:hypothetical protein